MSRPCRTPFCDPSELQKMLAHHAAGVSANRLGRWYHVDHTTIIYWLRKSGIAAQPRKQKAPPPPRKPRSIFDDRIVLRRMIEDFRAGYSTENIGHKFGVTKQCILVNLRRNNIKINRDKTWRQCRDLPRLTPFHLVDDEPINQGKTYADYLADAIKRGDVTIKAVVGNRSLTGYIH